jgi:drug/metabolite transporter (DMT)-like permease
MQNLITPNARHDRDQHGLADWVKLMLVALLWGTAFILLKTAVTEIPPTTVVMARLWIGTIALLVWMAIRGHKLPPLTPTPDRRWGWFMVLGFTGAAAPFALLSWGQQSLDSALVGILMAIMPLTTAALAHVFVPGERMTMRKFAGFFLGMIGVALLMGPDALHNLGGKQSIAQLAVILGAVFYAVQAIIARNLPKTRPSVAAAGLLLCAALMITPFGLYAAWHSAMPSAKALLSVLMLGLGATGLAGIVMMDIIRNSGPSFLSLSNYIMPLIAVLVGVWAGEQLGLSVWLGFVVILASLVLARQKKRQV